jgi:4-amino-4-deoxy-L-arabinose transferase-like glycosyltransferase
MRRALPYLLVVIPIVLMLVGNAFWTPVWYDDAGHWHVAREVAESGQFCYQLNSQTGECDAASQYITMGPLLTYPAAALVTMGADVWSLRWLVVAFTLLLLAAFGWLTAQATAGSKALWALLLVMGNIQLLTYGAQFLGETPMLAFLLLGAALQLRAMDKGGWLPTAGAALSWACAALIKESVLAPLGLGLILWLIYAIATRKGALVVKTLVLGAMPLLAVLGWYFIHAGSWAALMDYLKGRSAYSGEFLSLDLGVSLPYLALKPIIWLGMIAMVVKLRVRRQPKDVFLFCLFLGQLLVFVLGSGYDRHGFQLIFLPAIYLAEFAAFGWRWMTQLRKLGWVSRGAFLLLLLLFSVQQTPYLMWKRWRYRHDVNAPEREVAHMLHRQGVQRIFTYDQTLLPFLNASIAYRLEPRVPHAAAHCEPLRLQEGEKFVAGMYARDLYPNCVPWDSLAKEWESTKLDYAVFGPK